MKLVTLKSAIDFQNDTEKHRRNSACNAEKPHDNRFLLFSAGLPSDWYPNLDALKESCRIASSYNWADVDLSPFQGPVIKPQFYYISNKRTVSVKHIVALTCCFAHRVLSLVYRCSQNGFELFSAKNLRAFHTALNPMLWSFETLGRRTFHTFNLEVGLALLFTQGYENNKDNFSLCSYLPRVLILVEGTVRIGVHTFPC